jgi:hypothetical protein
MHTVSAQDTGSSGRFGLPEGFIPVLSFPGSGIAYLDEQDLKDIAEAEEDILQGRVYTTKELRAKLGIQ